MKKSWRTTLAGALLAGAYTAISALQSGISGKDLAIAGSIAVLGTLAKDFNVTGGDQTNG